MKMIMAGRDYTSLLFQPPVLQIRNSGWPKSSPLQGHYLLWWFPKSRQYNQHLSTPLPLLTVSFWRCSVRNKCLKTVGVGGKPVCTTQGQLLWMLSREMSRHSSLHDSHSSCALSRGSRPKAAPAPSAVSIAYQRWEPVWHVVSYRLTVAITAEVCRDAPAAHWQFHGLGLISGSSSVRKESDGRQMNLTFHFFELVNYYIKKTYLKHRETMKIHF